MTNHTPTPLEMLVRSIVATLDDYGFPDDQPANYRNADRSIALMALKDFHSEAKKLINKADNVRAVNSHQHLVEALKAIVAALTQPVQTSGLREPTTCDILRGDARFAVNTARQALNQAKL